MLLRLPNNLHYPITVTKVEKRVGDAVTRSDKLFLYTYTTTVTEGSRDGTETEVQKKFMLHFESTLEGTIKGWRVWEGDVLREPTDVCEIEEDCAHPVQYLGMCTNCGRDMTDIQVGSNSTDADRAPIRMTHDTTDLAVSHEEASRIDEEAKKRLLAARKLSLVVDLDQTIIHAAVDPTIDEWRKDKDNPNYEAVKDVEAFQLIDDGPGMRGCWYYIKLRPGLREFLEHISQLYELHIYTMGTRQYAQQIANIVDPDRKYFGERILSRDESGSIVAKNLERLFPVDTKMVVIIDDRGDVWKWSANLIRVTPFDFFVGIGDINSSFLPKKEDINTTPQIQNDDKAVTDTVTGPNGTVDHEKSLTNGVAEDGTSTIQDGASALEQLVAMGGGDDPAVRELQSKGQDETISSQVQDKPLLKLQKEQDEKDDAEAAAASEHTVSNDSTSSNGETQPTSVTESDSDSSDSSASQPPKTKARNSILRNDDEELIHLEARLQAVHAAFFAEYDRKRMSGKGGRVSALSGQRKAKLPTDEDTTSADLLLVPDVKKVMPAMKMRVLSGVTIVFSGVLPLGTDVQNADISTWAKTFGARVTEKVTKDVTHAIAARAGTAKVKQAIKRGIKVVGTPWLIESIQRWRKQDERPYLLEGASGQKHEGNSEGDMPEKVNMTAHDFLLSDSEEEETTAIDDTEEEGRRPKRLKLNMPEKRDPETDTEDPYDDKSPLTIGNDEWADMEAELREFMGSDADSESDSESVASTLSLRNDGSRKRKRAEESSLKTVASVPKTPQDDEFDNDEIRDEQRDIERDQQREEEDEEDSDDELARELERELEEEDDYGEDGKQAGFMAGTDNG